MSFFIPFICGICLGAAEIFILAAYQMLPLHTASDRYVFCGGDFFFFFFFFCGVFGLLFLGKFKI